MSTLYNLEPQPTAKVLLHTTAGDIELELFAQQTPLTSRNFLQHCLDSYYDNTIFHRLVPGFIIQGGDPTGTGHGGESSYDGGAPFADEFHSRLKFNRRGLLGMANTGEKNDNGSQFFLTLGKTEELTSRNTMFGRVAGDTIYNLVKMGEAELTEEEGSERPMYPNRITSTEVVVNPFEDMERRIKEIKPQVEEPRPRKSKQKKKGGKALLSFGAEEADEEDAAPIAKAKYNPKLISAENTTSSKLSTKRSATDTPNSERPSKRQLSPQAWRPSPAQQANQEARDNSIDKPNVQRSNIGSKRVVLNNNNSGDSEDQDTFDSDSDLVYNQKNTKLLSDTNAQIEALKSSLKREVPTAVSESKQPKNALEAMIPEGSIRGRKRPKQTGTQVNISREEQQTLDSFNAFKKRLEGAASSSAPRNGETQKTSKKNSGVDTNTPNKTDGNDLKASNKTPNKNNKNAADNDEEANLCDLHFIANCQSCSNWEVAEGEGGNDGDARDSDNDDIGWMGRELTFAKDRLGKDLEWKRQNEQDLVVIDPKEKAREIREDKKKERRQRDDGKVSSRR